MAKSDKTGHVELSVEQWNAIDLLVVGKTDQDVAETIGKSRQTFAHDDSIILIFGQSRTNDGGKSGEHRLTNCAASYHEHWTSSSKS